jgi:adenine C2-methylase RlmN of 23S rRNA A2503 and tRNA A37
MGLFFCHPNSFKTIYIYCALKKVSKDGTVKRAYALGDGQQIESVMMPYNDGRRTACVSSQVHVYPG